MILQEDCIRDSEKQNSLPMRYLLTHWRENITYHIQDKKGLLYNILYVINHRMCCVIFSWKFFREVLYNFRQLFQMEFLFRPQV